MKELCHFNSNTARGQGELRFAKYPCNPMPVSLLRQLLICKVCYYFSSLREIDAHGSAGDEGDFVGELHDYSLGV